MESKAVGMIGLGIMGSAMSGNLIRAGFKVLGYDVLPRRREEHRKAGGSAARDCREVARRCDIVVTSLPSSDALLDTAAELSKSSRAKATELYSGVFLTCIKDCDFRIQAYANRGDKPASRRKTP